MSIIVDDIRQVVDNVRLKYSGIEGLTPYYMFGHRIALANELLKKDKRKVHKYQKYPLIALHLDTPEEIVGDIVNYSLNLGIFAFTKSEYSPEQRYDKAFRTLLHPLYELFMKELTTAGLFSWDVSQGTPLHTKIDRPFWGFNDDEGNRRFIFNDPLDCVEIVDLQISKRIKNC